MANLVELLSSLIQVDDPSSRLYWPFLILSMIVITLYSGSKSFKDWFHLSSLLDLKLFFLNNFLKVFLFPLFLISSFQVSASLIKVFYIFFPNYSGFSLSDFWLKLMMTVIAFTLNDLFRFIHHYSMHKLPFLRQFHRAHHSALVLTPMTLFRAHPVEVFLASMRNVMTVGCTMALVFLMTKKNMSGFDILGVNILGFLFNAALANLRHSSVPISFGFLEYIFISPRMHQIHHSNHPRHYNKNYGVALSLWDQLMGSFYRPAREEVETISFGLSRFLTPSHFDQATTLKGALVPFWHHNRESYSENKNLNTRTH